MPCMQCSNGKWKYGAGGNCQFNSEDDCKRAAAAIHAKPEKQEDYTSEMLDAKEIKNEGT